VNFNGKRILVTGSTMGIGRATAECFHSAGAAVAINGRTGKAVAQAIAEIGAKGGKDRLVAAPADLGTEAGCHACVAAAVGALGGLDCLVNNTGICPLAHLRDVTEAHWDEVMAVNLTSAMLCTQAALPALRQVHGNVVMVASAAGLIAGPTDSFVYAISKAAMIGMTKALALELAPENIRVNAVCPGYINTPMVRAENEASGGQIERFISRAVPLRRIGSMEECASIILYAASSTAGYCTGSILVDDGGLMANGSWGGKA
jgi:NAD(P)-dependent dehydrogenase (short-subunit alcohol dehydrogenase family)